MKQDFVDIHKGIVELAQDGDQLAQRKLYQLYSGAMYNICCRMMSDQTDAEDMLQEAFIEAFTKLNTFRFQSTFGAWLKRIVVNKCINQLRKRKLELVGSESGMEYDIEEEKDIDEEQVQYDVERVKKAIERLPEGYRLIFNLYMMEGYDHVEISEILGISESTSKSQFMRAKRKVKEILVLN